MEAYGTPVIPALQRLQQEGASLDNIMSFGQACATKQVSASLSLCFSSFSLPSLSPSLPSLPSPPPPHTQAILFRKFIMFGGGV